MIAIAQPAPNDDASSDYIASLVERVLQEPPQGWDEDKKMFDRYGLTPMKSFERGGYKGSNWSKVKEAAALGAEAPQQPAVAAV